MRPGFHLLVKSAQLLALRFFVEIDGSGMPYAAVADEFIRFCHGVVEVLRFIHGEHGGQLLVRKFFAEVGRRHFAYQDFGVFGDFESGQSGDGMRGLSDDFRVQSAR